MSISKVIAAFTNEKNEVTKRKLKVVCPNASQGTLNGVYNDIRAVFPEYLYDENFFIEIDGKKFGDCVRGLKSLDIVIKVECCFVKKYTKENQRKKISNNGWLTLIFEFTPKHVNDTNEAIVKDVWKKNWRKTFLMSRVNDRDDRIENAEELKDYFDEFSIDNTLHTLQLLVVSFLFYFFKI
ncbi:hypothetical protein RFI_25288 [Reticulomyxa filosa]|uniref:Uncharacterized protein n=1 Tax=Reticulomyxa filosa TaxID=46433 RepID=X6MF93_RETFI|nr:hypothetical protein RFI_25288 [Reticulomyxa filosa]|eukprot:ETO12087.1 hypothetical protein RFI_25288 [Reticulomyxa filosa]